MYLGLIFIFIAIMFIVKEIISYRKMKTRIRESLNNSNIKPGLVYVYNRTSFLFYNLEITLMINDKICSDPIKYGKFFEIPVQVGDVIYDGNSKKVPDLELYKINLDQYDSNKYYIYQVHSGGGWKKIFKEITIDELNMF